MLYNESKSSCTLCLVDLVGLYNESKLIFIALCLVDLVGLYNESKLIFMRTVFGGPGGAVQ